MAAFTPGSVVAGRFRIDGWLGEGGLAEVFSAVDPEGRELALKALHPHLARLDEARERFRREMNLTRRVAGPGIVTVFEMLEDGGRPFFTMERLRGMTLADRLERGPLRGDEARRIAWEICAALRGAHAVGAIHRDLKPQNVFLTSQGVKLLDFGAAKASDEPALTRSRILGTPGYIAPEVWEGDPPDPRSDLYAVGAMLFEMISGQRAFAADDPSMLAALQRAPPDPRHLRRTCGEHAPIVARALAPDPEERFLTAAQFMTALEGGTVAPPPPPAPRYSRGEYDVVVHQAVNLLAPFRRDAGIGALLRRLDLEASWRWRLRLAGAGEATLVAGASRACAGEIAAACAKHRVPATVRESARRSSAEAWLARSGALLLMVIAGGVAALAAALLSTSARECALGAAAAAFLGYLLSWGLRPAISLSPLRDLPERTTSRERFAAGLRRRASALERKARRLPQSARIPLDAAASSARSAMEVARAAPRDPVPSALLACAARADELLDAVRAIR
ncbi:MAG: serine/threonine-protein kinase [Myxococcales bacterium]